MLARGAARLAGVHGVKPGDRAVVWAEQPEALEHVRTLAAAGVEIAAVVAPEGLDTAGVEAEVIRGEVTAATGKKRLKGVVAGGRTIACDLLAVGSEIQANEHLVRLAYDLPAVAAGDAAGEGATLDEAAASGTRRRPRGRRRARAVRRRPVRPAHLRHGRHRLPLRGRLGQGPRGRDRRGHGVGRAAEAVHDRHHGPLPGPACAPTSCARSPSARIPRRSASRTPTTLRPPTRPITLEQAIAGAVHHMERHTALTETHLASGASMMWAGPWKRVEAYNGDVAGRVQGGARARRPDRRRHARQVPRRRARRDRVPGAHLPDARRRPRGGPPALRAAARGGRRDHRRRHRLRPRRRPLLPDGHHVGRRAARVVDAGLGRGLGPRRLRRQPDRVARRAQRRRARTRASCCRSCPRTRSTRRASRTSGTGRSPSPACRASPCGSASSASWRTSCTSRRRSPTTSGAPSSRPARSGTSAPSASWPSACCASRRATSSSRRTPTSRRRRGRSACSGPSSSTSPTSSARRRCCAARSATTASCWCRGRCRPAPRARRRAPR